MNTDNNITISDKLTKIKVIAGLNQVEFAKKIGVAQSYLSDLERGKREITVKVLNSLIYEFNISSDWLLANKGEMFIKDESADESLELAKEYFEKEFSSKLEPDNYEYRQIVYYNKFSTSLLRTHNELELDSLIHTRESYKKLVGIIHYLSPKSFLATEKYTGVSDFSTYMKESTEEYPFLNNNRSLSQQNERVNLILRILWFRREREFYNDLIYNCIYYMEKYKDFLKEEDKI